MGIAESLAEFLGIFYEFFYELFSNGIDVQAHNIHDLIVSVTTIMLALAVWRVVT